MSNTSKPLSEYDLSQVLQKSFNPTEGTLAVGSFVSGKLGHKIVRTIVSPTVDTYSYFDGATLLHVLTVTYDDSTHSNVNQVERTA